MFFVFLSHSILRITIFAETNEVNHSGRGDKKLNDYSFIEVKQGLSVKCSRQTLKIMAIIILGLKFN